MFIVKTTDPTLPGRVESLINNTAGGCGGKKNTGSPGNDGDAAIFPKDWRRTFE